MADKTAGDMLYTAFSFALLVGACVWIGAILATRGEERLVQACRPVEFTTTAFAQTVATLVGGKPQWVLYTERSFMTGCYYFFGIIFSPKGQTIGAEAPKDTNPNSAGGIYNARDY
ncbi:MAG: hypothetical protein EBQ80_03575 [Proteobacteria bacterium]|nr:hypothetical protein [Pseudomonadota bacterium]